MPAHKKHASTRARRNKTPGAATLTRRTIAAVPDSSEYDDLTIAQLRAQIDERNLYLPDDERISKAGRKADLADRLAADDARSELDHPALPDRIDGWHDLTRAYWDDIWASPMSEEWDESDLHNVYMCALLYDDMWRGEKAADRKNAASEHRLQRAALGLDPYSRRRLEWTIEAADEAKTRGEQRRSRPESGPTTGKRGAAAKKDPRAGLHAV